MWWHSPQADGVGLPHVWCMVRESARQPRQRTSTLQAPTGVPDMGRVPAEMLRLS